MRHNGFIIGQNEAIIYDTPTIVLVVPFLYISKSKKLSTYLVTMFPLICRQESQKLPTIIIFKLLGADARP